MIIGLAPMDGFTDCAFRQIVKEIFLQWGEQDKYKLYLWTEFMNADGYIINPPGVIKHLLTIPQQSPIIVQIFGANQEMLIKCFDDIQKKYSKLFSGIELNMGCPAKNIMNTGGGSALIKDKKKTLQLIQTLHDTITMPLSIKTRIGIDEEDQQAQMKFMIEASKYLDMITIHGRTVKQGYAGQADWNFVYELKKYCNPNCKILGNGSITSYEAIASFGKNLDGVMIGQAAIGNPWIFTPHVPTKEERKTTILKHLDYMITYEHFFQQQKNIYTGILAMPNNISINTKYPSVTTLAEFRKHLFQYVKGLPGSKEFKQKVSTIVEYNKLVKEIQEFFI